LLAGATVVSGQPQDQPPPQGQPREGQPVDGQPGQRPPRGPRPDGAPGREMLTVDAGMKAMRQGLRVLRDAAGDPSKKDASLQAVGLMQRGCLAAKASVPKHLKEGVSVEDYRREQIKLMGMLLELELSLLDGKHDQAAAMVEKLAKFRDDAHEKFGEGEDEDAAPAGQDK
ncbi:MAG: hypothetical protein L6Q35_15810, partial [Phycisphaerales bacterium]|nr:hypothetical protein [Phycisphaerales bacterium]